MGGKVDGVVDMREGAAGDECLVRLLYLPPKLKPAPPPPMAPPPPRLLSTVRLGWETAQQKRSAVWGTR